MKGMLLASFLAASLALLALGTGCSGSTETSGKGGNTVEGGESTPLTVVPPQEEDEVEGKGKKWGGWRYKGARDNCHFLYSGRCFKSEKKACKAAGCSVDDCTLEGAGPATVSCKK